jgi:hypothetical protein
MARGALRQAGIPYGCMKGTLYGTTMKMVSVARARLLIDVCSRGRKEPLPDPSSVRLSILLGKRTRQRHPERGITQVATKLLLHPIQVTLQVRHDDSGQRRNAITATLRLANDDSPTVELDVFDAKW